VTIYAAEMAAATMRDNRITLLAALSETTWAETGSGDHRLMKLEN
jgi:hypothetical protein